MVENTLRFAKFCYSDGQIPHLFWILVLNSVGLVPQRPQLPTLTRVWKRLINKLHTLMHVITSLRLSWAMTSQLWLVSQWAQAQGGARGGSVSTHQLIPATNWPRLEILRSFSSIHVYVAAERAKWDFSADNTYELCSEMNVSVNFSQIVTDISALVCASHVYLLIFRHLPRMEGFP